jgi:hypothetical protein
MPNTGPAAAEGLPEINRRKALGLTGTGIIAALGGRLGTAGRRPLWPVIKWTTCPFGRRS